MANAALDDVFAYFRSGAHVAIYDGTNSTCQRRKMLMKRIHAQAPKLAIKTVFIEIICNDPEGMFSAWRRKSIIDLSAAK